MASIMEMRNHCGVTQVEARKVLAGGNLVILSLKSNSVARNRRSFLLVSTGRHSRLWDPAPWHVETCLQSTLCRCAIKRPDIGIISQ